MRVFEFLLLIYTPFPLTKKDRLLALPSLPFLCVLCGSVVKNLCLCYRLLYEPKWAANDGAVIADVIIQVMLDSMRIH